MQLLIGDIAYDERARKDLITILEEMVGRVKRQGLSISPPVLYEELLSQLAATDVVIASRFHNVLLSLDAQQAGRGDFLP